MTVNIDLKARVFAADDKAWRLFPGQTYRHYNIMRERSIVFLDYPHFPLPDHKEFEKSDYIKQEIARAELRKDAVMRPNTDVEQLLIKIANENLDKVQWSKSRNLALGWLNALYYKASVGDLVLMPGPGFKRNQNDEWEFYPSMVGELSGQVERWNRDGPEQYIRAGYLTRRVKWLGTIDERDLDRQTTSALRTQNAIVSINPEKLEDVLGAAYKNVIVKDEYLARFTTENEDFTAHENFHFQAFIMATVAACRQLSDNNHSVFDKSIYEIAAREPRNQLFVPDQNISIHSPGYTTLSAISSVPFVIATLFALALDVTASPFDVNGNADISMVNSESDALDPCDAGIELQVKQSLNIIGYERWQEMCRAAKFANENHGLSPITKTIP